MNNFRPIIGLVIRFTARCSCSMMLLRSPQLNIKSGVSIDACLTHRCELRKCGRRPPHRSRKENIESWRPKTNSSPRPLTTHRSHALVKPSHLCAGVWLIEWAHRISGVDPAVRHGSPACAESTDKKRLIKRIQWRRRCQQPHIAL